MKSKTLKIKLECLISEQIFYFKYLDFIKLFITKILIFTSIFLVNFQINNQQQHHHHYNNLNNNNNNNLLNNNITDSSSTIINNNNNINSLSTQLIDNNNVNDSGDEQKYQHHHQQQSIINNNTNLMESDEISKSHVSFSITESIKSKRKASDTNNNLHDIVNHFNEFIFAADQNNNSSSDNSVGKEATNFHAKLRSHQMQQLLQQHVFTPHQLQQLIVNQPIMATPKESLFHFEQKRKQMEILMHQIQEQLHANILQQTHLLQQQHSPNSDKKNSPTIQLQQKLAIQQQELAQQFQLIQRQYLLHQSGMQLLFPQHHQSQSGSGGQQQNQQIQSL